MHTQVPRLVPKMLATAMSDRNPEIRSNLFAYLFLVLSCWSEAALCRTTPEEVAAAVRKGTSDASVGARCPP